MAHRRNRERGGALMLAVIVTLAVMAISGAFISHSMIRAKGTVDSMLGIQALSAAESAASEHVMRLNMAFSGISGAPPTRVDRKLGLSGYARIWTQRIDDNDIDEDNSKTADDLSESQYVVLWVDGYAGGTVNDDGSYSGGARRTVQVILSHKDGGVFWNAVYAGNSSGSKDYNLFFGSGGGKEDIIKGDIYSGGGLIHDGDAQLLDAEGIGPGTQVMYARDGGLVDGSTTSNPTYLQGTQPELDVAAMDYAQKADPTNAKYDDRFVDVASILNDSGKSHESFIKDGYGLGDGTGLAVQTKGADDLGHLFRKNPQDSTAGEYRSDSYGKTKTVKDDFFLEDVSQPKGNGSPRSDGNPKEDWLGTDGGQRIKINEADNNKVYYIDGNLWLSNSPAYTFQFLNESGSNMQITIVVRGNIYLTDNLLYDRTKTNDAIALIAINDENHQSINPEDFADPSHPQYNAGLVSLEEREDAARDWNKDNGSGNIFFGDPSGGTTERFESFLYAQNNFYDHNLGGSGTNLTNIYGNMTAGNQVQIKRTEDPTKYKPMQINFDDRIRRDLVSLPGLPGNPEDTGQNWRIAAWRQVPSKPTGLAP